MLLGFVIINKSELVCTSTEKYKEFVDHKMTLKYKDAVFFDRCEMVFFKSTYYLRRGFQGIQGILWSKPGGVRCLSFQLARRISSCFGHVLSGLVASCLAPYSQILSPGSKVFALEGCQSSGCRHVGVTQLDFRIFFDKSILFKKEFCQIFLYLLLLAGLKRSA